MVRSLVADSEHLLREPVRFLIGESHTCSELPKGLGQVLRQGLNIRERVPEERSPSVLARRYTKLVLLDSIKV